MNGRRSLPPSEVHFLGGFVAGAEVDGDEVGRFKWDMNKRHCLDWIRSRVLRSS